ncbi:MAG: hypothetical protein QXU40_03575 [Candidatus Pacearchaeota archaeon]
MEDLIKFYNTIKIWQSENGIKVPDSEVELKNVTENSFYIQLFREIYNGTGALALTDLYNGTTGDDGIVVVQSGGTVLDKLNTSYNSGGNGTTDTYIEYYGEKLYTTAKTIIQVRLYRDYNVTGEVRLGYANVNYSVAAGRRLHIYYKLSKPSGTIQSAEEALSSA